MNGPSNATEREKELSENKGVLKVLQVEQHHGKVLQDNMKSLQQEKVMGNAIVPPNTITDDMLVDYTPHVAIVTIRTTYKY